MVPTTAQTVQESRVGPKMVSHTSGIATQRTHQIRIFTNHHSFADYTVRKAEYTISQELNKIGCAGGVMTITTIISRPEGSYFVNGEERRTHVVLQHATDNCKTVIKEFDRLSFRINMETNSMAREGTLNIELVFWVC